MSRPDAGEGIEGRVREGEAKTRGAPSCDRDPCYLWLQLGLSNHSSSYGASRLGSVTNTPSLSRYTSAFTTHQNVSLAFATYLELTITYDTALVLRDKCLT